MSAYEKAWEALAYIRGDHVTWEEAEDRLASALTDLLAEHASLRNAIEIEREGQRSMAYALAEINRLSRLSVAINLVAPPADAATEAVREGAAILRRRLDTGRECRDCGEVPGLKGMVDDFLDLVAATPAPAPTTHALRRCEVKP